MANLRLRTQLILLLLAIGLIPAVVTSAITLFITADQFRERVILDEQNHHNDIIANMTRFLDTAESDILILANSAVIRDLAATIVSRDSLRLEQLRRTLEQEFLTMAQWRRVGDTPIYEHIRFLNADGFEFVRIDNKGDSITAAPGFGLNVRNDEDYFVQAQALNAGEIYVAPLELFDEFGEIQEPYTPVLRYSTPIYHEDTFVGVLVTDVRAREFLQFVQNLLSPDDISFLVDHDGYYLSHPDEQLLYGRDLNTGERLQNDFPQLVALFERGQAGVVDLDEFLAIYQPFSPPGIEENWFLVTLRPQASVLAFIRTQQQALMLTIAVIAVVVVGIAFWVGQSISRPIVELTETATVMAQGQLDRQIKLNRKDEIGQLAAAFNSMSAQLRDFINSLETRVAERTRDLEAAADVSRQISTVLALDKLLAQVVELTRQRFNLYHVFVFLLNENGDTLEMASVTGGLIKLFTPEERNIACEARPSIVAQAAREKQAVVVNDVQTNPNYLSLAPVAQTRSEVAVPMILGDKLIGVMDFESTHPDYFGADDVRVFTSLAQQVAVAVNNARLFAEQLRVAEELRQLEQMKTRFLSSMSHELRTPLNAVINFGLLMRDGAYGEVNEGQLSALNMIISSGEHLLSLVNDVLDMSKIEAGRMSFYMEDIDLKPELQQAVETARGLIGERDTQLIVNIPHSLPKIHGDKRRLRQLFLNLLSNAVKFTNSKIVVQVEHKDSHLVISVVDDGPGVPQDSVERIFEAFHQTPSGVEQGTGTGLGLPISRYFAEAHGGKLWVESVSGEGATFYLSLPIARVESV